MRSPSFSLAVFANARKVTLYSRHALLVFGCLALASPSRGDGYVCSDAWGNRPHGVASAACEGAGRAGLHLLWAERLACFERRVAWPAYAAAFVVAPLAYCLVAFVPDAAAIAIAPLLLIVSCLFLWLSACLVGSRRRAWPRARARKRAQAPATQRMAHPVARVDPRGCLFVCPLHVALLFGWVDGLGPDRDVLLVGLSLFVACRNAAVGRLDLCAIYRLCPPVIACSPCSSTCSGRISRPRLAACCRMRGLSERCYSCCSGLTASPSRRGRELPGCSALSRAFRRLPTLRGTQVGMWLRRRERRGRVGALRA